MSGFLTARDDIALIVFSYLDKFSLGKCEVLCRKFSCFLQQHLCWYNLLCNEIPSYFPSMDPLTAKIKLRDWTAKAFHWQSVGRTHACSKRYLHRCAVTSTSGGTAVFFGGGSEPDGAVFNESWRVQLGVGSNEILLEEIYCRGSARELRYEVDGSGLPIARRASAMCGASSMNTSTANECVNRLDAVDHVFMFGGATSPDYTHFSDGLWWLRVSTSKASDEGSDEGNDEGIDRQVVTTSSDIDKLREPRLVGTWTLLSTLRAIAGNGQIERASSVGVGPIGRWGHTMISFDGFLVLFGGSCPGETFQDVWAFDIAANIGMTPAAVNKGWIRLSFTNPIEEPTMYPCARGGHSAAVVDGHMYVFGGNTLTETFNDLWRVDLRGLRVLRSDRSTPHDVLFSWEMIHAESNYPPPGIGHCFIPMGKYIVLYGGRNLFRRIYNGGVFVYDTVNCRWDNPRVGGSVQHRTGHCAIATPLGILFFGGLLSDERVSNEMLFLQLFGNPSESELSRLNSLRLAMLENEEEKHGVREGKFAMDSSDETADKTNASLANSSSSSFFDDDRTNFNDDDSQIQCNDRSSERDHTVSCISDSACAEIKRDGARVSIIDHLRAVVGSFLRSPSKEDRGGSIGGGGIRRSEADELSWNGRIPGDHASVPLIKLFLRENGTRLC